MGSFAHMYDTDGDRRPQPLLDTKELADHYGLCRASVYNLMARGMPSVKIGRSRRFRLSETDGWLSAQQEAS